MRVRNSLFPHPRGRVGRVLAYRGSHAVQAQEQVSRFRSAYTI